MSLVLIPEYLEPWATSYVPSPRRSLLKTSRSALGRSRSSSDSTPDPSMATSYSNRFPPVKNV